MPTTVSTDVRLDGDVNLTRLFEFAHHEVRVGGQITRDHARGVIGLDDVITFVATPDQLRQLARLLDGAADQMDRLFAEAQQLVAERTAEQAKTIGHCGSMEQAAAVAP
jgi:hypothetical protein